MGHQSLPIFEDAVTYSIHRLFNRRGCQLHLPQGISLTAALRFHQINNGKPAVIYLEPSLRVIQELLIASVRVIFKGISREGADLGSVARKESQPIAPQYIDFNPNTIVFLQTCWRLSMML